jgi:hypothetical protein
VNDLDLPPFPAMGATGPQVCEAVRFYLAIVDELPFEQVRVLSAHVQECSACAAEFRMIQHVTRLVTTLPESVPSKRVDDAIMAAIQQRGSQASLSPQVTGVGSARPLVRRLPERKHFMQRRSAALALAAALLVLVLGGVFLRNLIFPSGSSQAFTLPQDLSWNGYVLHYTQARVDTQGRSYQVEVYQDLGSNQMHIESSMQGQFDVVVVTDAQDMLGEDMMHHVAEKGEAVASWAIDGSLFNLSELRQDLAKNQMIYLGQETFQGEQVYILRSSNNQILLLNMQYMPVNVLQGYTGPGTGKPFYQTFTLMPAAQVSNSMWDMQVPSNFRMGQLPAQS